MLIVVLKGIKNVRKITICSHKGQHSRDSLCFLVPMKKTDETPPCLLRFIVHGEEIARQTETGAYRHYVPEIVLSTFMVWCAGG